MGPLPRAEKAPLQIQVLEELRFDGYTREKITYEALAARGRSGRFQAARAGRKLRGCESNRNGP